jgi:hypothetical protein
MVTEELIAPNLEPADIIRMIDDPQGIGISIHDPDLNGRFF